MTKRSTQLIVAAALGGFTFYVYLCFFGVVSFWMSDSGLEVAIYSAINNVVPKGDLRWLFYWFFTYARSCAINILLTFLGAYLVRKYLPAKAVATILAFTVGAVIADVMIVAEFSYFDIGGAGWSFVNLVLWIVCTAIALWLVSLLKVKSAAE